MCFLSCFCRVCQHEHSESIAKRVKELSRSRWTACHDSTWLEKFQGASGGCCMPCPCNAQGRLEVSGPLAGNNSSSSQECRPCMCVDGRLTAEIADSALNRTFIDIGCNKGESQACNMQIYTPTQGSQKACCYGRCILELAAPCPGPVQATPAPTYLLCLTPSLASDPTPSRALMPRWSAAHVGTAQRT